MTNLVKRTPLPGERRALKTEWGALLFLTAATALFFWPLWVAGYRFPQRERRPLGSLVSRLALRGGVDLRGLG